MDLVLTCLLGTVLVLVITAHCIKSALAPKVALKGKTNVPCPEGLITLPILGNAWYFMGASSMKDLWDLADRLYSSTTSCASLWLGPKLLIGVTAPKLAEYLLSSSRASNKDPDFYDNFNKMTDGLFSRNGKGWSDLRRPLDKLLHSKIIMNNYVDVFKAKSVELCKLLDIYCDSGPVDIQGSIESCLVDMVFETLLGIPSTQARKLGFASHWSKSLPEMCMTMNIKVQYKFKWLYSLSKMKVEFEALQERIRHFGQKLYNCRRDILAANGWNPEDEGLEPKCYTDVAMKVARDENQDGHSMIFDLLVAGYDTTSVAVASTCLFLGMHPEYQEKAYQEQIAIMGDSLQPPNREEIDRMSYLLMVYQETLRHVAPPQIVRQLSSEVVVDDNIFPEGTSLYVALHSLGMKKEYWERPKEFYPDHFLPEKVSKRPRGSFLPFSAGLRGCPGKAYSLVASKVMLSVLIRRFKFTSPLKFSDMEYKMSFMIESTKGYPVELTRRTTPPTNS